MKFAVLGNGAWGTALARLLYLNHQEVILWGIDKNLSDDINNNHKLTKYFQDSVILPEKLKSTTNLNEAVKNADALGRIVNATMEVGKSVKGYLDGELDEAELADDLSEKGSGMATALLAETIAKQTALGTVIEAGGLAGGIVGVVVSTVGYMVGTAVYNQVKKRAIKIAEIDENIEKFNRMADQVLEYRQQLEKNLKELEIKNTETIMNSFKKMEQSIFDNDVNTFTNSLNDICEIFGKEVKFKSNKEFLDFWNDPNMVLEI